MIQTKSNLTQNLEDTDRTHKMSFSKPSTNVMLQIFRFLIE